MAGLDDSPAEDFISLTPEEAPEEQGGQDEAAQHHQPAANGAVAAAEPAASGAPELPVAATGGDQGMPPGFGVHAGHVAAPAAAEQPLVDAGTAPAEASGAEAQLDGDAPADSGPMNGVALGVAAAEQAAVLEGAQAAAPVAAAAPDACAPADARGDAQEPRCVPALALALITYTIVGSDPARATLAVGQCLHCGLHMHMQLLLLIQTMLACVLPCRPADAAPAVDAVAAEPATVAGAAADLDAGPPAEEAVAAAVASAAVAAAAEQAGGEQAAAAATAEEPGAAVASEPAVDDSVKPKQSEVAVPSEGGEGTEAATAALGVPTPDTPAEQLATAQPAGEAEPAAAVAQDGAAAVAPAAEPAVVAVPGGAGRSEAAGSVGAAVTDDAAEQAEHGAEAETQAEAASLPLLVFEDKGESAG